MKRKPPVRDNHLAGLDHYAMMLSILNKNGVGKIPNALYEVGWFGSQELTTMLCPISADIDERIVRYVKLYPDGSYSYYYDSEGDLVTCTPQSLITSAREIGNPDVISYIEHLEGEVAKVKKETRAMLTPTLIRTLTATDNQEDFEKICAASDLSPNAVISVLSDIEAENLAREDYEHDKAIEVVGPYVQRVQNGEPVALVIKSMHHDGVSEFEIMAFSSAIEFLETQSWEPLNNTKGYIN